MKTWKLQLKLISTKVTLVYEYWSDSKAAPTGSVFG